MLRRSLICTLALVAVLMPAAAVDARVPAGFVGMTSDELGGVFTSDAYRTQALSAQRRAGVRLLRQTFTWAYIEQQPFGRYPLPRFNWALQDRVVLAAARAGITVLPVLFDPPGFLSSRPPRGGARATYPPRSAARMASFADAAVARYGPDGTLWRANPGVRARPIRSWQVWNEPTLPAYWGGRPSASEYVRLLQTVGEAIKKRDRRAEIVSAGLPPSVLPGAVPIRRFLEQMYRAGAKRAFDTLAVNTYARNARELGRLLRSIRSVMDRRGDRRARIWLTELGWCDTGPRHRFCVGKRRQAALIRSSLALIRKERRRLKLRGFVYFSWRDGRPYAPDFRDHWGLHTGLLKLDGKAKPSLRTFRRAVRPFR